MFQGVAVPEKVFWELCETKTLEELDEKLLDLWRKQGGKNEV